MKLNYRKMGQGAPVVILHGFLGTLDNWITVGRALSEDYTVYLVDQRNHGRSPHSDEFSYDILSQDLHIFLHEHNIAFPSIIGHSMGGKVAMNYTMKHSSSFRHLIIVDIAPRYYPVHHQKILEGLISMPFDQIQSRNDAELHLSKFIDSPGVRQFLMKNLERNKNGYSWKPNVKVLNRDIEKVGQEIFNDHVSTGSVYFIRGDKSDYIGKEDREMIKKMYPSSRILTIKDTGHWVHAEQQESFLKTVQAILKS